MTTEITAKLTLYNSTGDLITGHNNLIQELADKHAPVKRTGLLVHPHAEWFTTDLQSEKKGKKGSWKGS